MQPGRVIVAALVAHALLACGLCEGPERPSQATLVVDRGSACPTADEARPRVVTGTVRRLVGVNGQRDIPGQQQCCYHVHYHRTALDAEVDLYYFAQSSAPCASAADVMRNRQRYPLYGEPGDGSGALTLWSAPPNTTIVEVLSGPKEIPHACQYRARVRRAEARFVEDLCSVNIAFSSGGYDLALCPAAETRLEGAKASSYDEVESIDTAPVLGSASTGLATECVYDVITRNDADHCG